MNSKLFRWIAFAVCVLLAIIALIVHTATGFLCFAVAAFITIPINRIFGKLDSDLDAKYRKRATFITTIIFFLCGLFAFTTAGSSSAKENSNQAATTTVAITTEATTTTTTTTVTTTTTTLKTTITTTSTTTTALETTTTTVPTTTVTTTIAEVATEAQAIVPEANNDPIVIITESGSCYHRKKHGKNWTVIAEIPQSQAIAEGYSPCGICYK
ncbi:MAG: hypothetical protein MSA74_08820 [Ruminococcus sp.]|nr:hypothetical protein [Ruminococcus sp.]